MSRKITIHLEPAMVPASLRGQYSGKTFKAMVCTETTIPADAGLWSGGTRELYHAIDLSTGAQVIIPGQDSIPWNGARRDRTIRIQPGFALVTHSMFCGKDMGLTFYVHPDNAAKLLPAPQAELSEHERIVLNATCSYKASYKGQDRYDMARRAVYGEARDGFPSREEWATAKQSLILKGLLNKGGAITPAGRNARAGEQIAKLLGSRRTPDSR